MAKHRPSRREVIAEKLAVQDAKRDVRRLATYDVIDVPRKRLSEGARLAARDAMGA